MKPDENLVSVIIPAYNLKNYVDKTISTILSQKYKNFELIVVDDRSNDGTATVLDELAKTDERINVYHFDKHRGVSAARNFGIDKAQGKYIFFIDGDDAIENDFLEKLIYPMDNENVDMTIAGYSWNNRIDHLRSKGNSNYFEVSKKDAYASVNTWGDDIGGYVWNKSFKTDIIKKNSIRFDESLELAEDLLFTAEYMLKANKFMYYPEILYHKISRSSSIVHNANFLMRNKEKKVRDKIDELGKNIK